jgi:hypothetical protein
VKQPQNILREEEQFAMDLWILPQVSDIRESILCGYMGLGFYAVIIVGRVELRFKGYFTMTA